MLVDPLRYMMDLAHSRDSVWDCWTDASRLGEWLGTNGSVSIEPTVGGRFCLERVESVVDGRVLFIDRPRLLELAWPLDGQVTLVEARLYPTLDGTRLEVTHREVEQRLRDRAERWWQQGLERLRMVLARR